MKHNPLITVIIPVYNAGGYLRPALKSIINQTYQNLEIIIVDDGSTDGCIDTIDDIIGKDKRICVLKQKNCGKSVALNKALDIMRGEFWGIQDGDDLSYADRLEKQIAVLARNEELAAVYVGHDLIVNGKQMAPRFGYKGVEECKKLIENFKMPAHDATGLYRVSMVKQMRFDPELRIGQGFDYALRVGEEFPILLMGECLYTYRINYNSTIRRNAVRNIAYINRVFVKAIKRRGVHMIIERRDIGAEYRRKRRFKDNHIIAHCMESILDLKNARRFREALKVVVSCCKLNCFDRYYYKPIIYWMMPTKLISLYRSVKERYQKSRQVLDGKAG
jgi:glycosyltransferase involved in cell wall biosynthesis